MGGTKFKYLWMRGLAIGLIILRYFVMFGLMFYIGYLAVNFLDGHVQEIFSGSFVLTAEGWASVFKAVIVFGVLVVLFFLGRPLENFRSYTNTFIDDFADTARYSRKKNLKKGELDEFGNLFTGLKLQRGSLTPMEDLDKLIGLAGVKLEIRKIRAVLEFERRSTAKAGKQFCRHYAFLGAPGTGKTTVARIFAGLLYQNKQIKRNMYLECTGNDLTGEFMGQTKTKVDAIYNMGKGGVIFIDEAYALCGGDYGTPEMAAEAISQLLVHMESDPYTVIIFAGYTGPMQQFFGINPGLSSRISRQIEFPNYNAEELVLIFKKFADEKKVVLATDAEAELLSLFKMKLYLVDKSKANFSNGRYVRNCLNEIYQQHALNEVESSSSQFDRLSNLITKADILGIHNILLELD